MRAPVSLPLPPLRPSFRLLPFHVAVYFLSQTQQLEWGIEGEAGIGVFCSLARGARTN